MLPLSVIVSSAINLLLFSGILSFQYFKFMWLLNGVSQSVLWSSLMLTLSRNLDEKYIKKAIIAMSTTASIGTFFAYGLSAGFALFDGFKLSFLVAAVIMTIAGVAWLILYDKITVKENAVAAATQESGELPVKQKTDKSVIKILIIFGIFAVVVNFIKDGLTDWVPKILSDTYALSDSLSIVLTLVLPILTIFGTTLVVFLNKKIKDYTALMSILFVFASIFIAVVLVLLSTPLWLIILLIFGIISLLMSGSNNVVTSILPLSLRDKANSGFVAGILNGCCYLGSTLSSVGLGALSDYFGEWQPIFYFLLGASVFVVVVSVGILVGKKIKSKTTV